MSPRNALRTAPLALALLTTAISATTLAQRIHRRAPRGSPGTCVHFTRTAAPDGRSIEFELENQCPIAVEGIVSWRVTCGEDGSDREHREPLHPGERRVFEASVDACGARTFGIENVRWSWAQATEE